MLFSLSSLLYRRTASLFLITFCVHILLPSVAIADDSTTESGTTLSSDPIEVLSPQPSSQSSGSSVSSPSEADSNPLLIGVTEVMWMGTDISTADEWVEISAIATDPSRASFAASLSGWTLSVLKGTAESVIVRFPQNMNISAGSSVILSNYTKDASRLAVDPLLTSTAMSLPNTKLLLRLRNSSGTLIDEVDDGVGNPFAGSNPSGSGPKASMERIDLKKSGNDATNWKTATDSTGFDLGSPLFGTPGYFSSANTPVTSQATSMNSFSSSQSSAVSSIASELVMSALPSESSDSSVSSTTSNSDHINSSSIQSEPYSEPIINELLPDPKGVDTAEWIEIFNSGSSPLNLSGMTIRVGTTGHRIKGTASGFIVAGHGIVIVPKSSGGFSLSNNGATVRLESGSTLLDSLTYPATPEGVSVGRLGTTILSFCMPSPGRQNASLPVDAKLVVDSGKLSGIAPITVNLGIHAESGSLASATCHTDFGDGYTSGSCNPATHTIQATGDYAITLQVHDYCGNTVIQTLTGNVTPKPFSYHSTSLQSKNIGAVSCTPSSFSGVTITEILPNPTGDETGGEWIEVHNETEKSASLCGWSVDDGEGGSKPALLSGLQVEPHAYMVLPRTLTKVALNNDHDAARLIAPLPTGGTGVALSISFDMAPDDQAYAVDANGNWNWTPYSTPGAENQFQEPAQAFAPSLVSLVAALPNPKGVDTFDEYIELRNAALGPIWLTGWSIRNAKGKELDLTGTVIAKVETKRIPLYRLSYSLGNESDTLYLIDNAHTVRSVLSWKQAGVDEMKKPFQPEETATGVLVRQVIDGDTIVVQINDQPNHLETVRLLGVDAPEMYDENTNISQKGFMTKNFIRALIINKKVDLQFDTKRKDKYGRLLAYVFMEGRDVQQELLTQGMAYAYREYPVGRLEEYSAYESIARTLSAGIWSKPDLVTYYDGKIADQERWSEVTAHGLSLKADLPEGMVFSGSTLHFALNEPANLYVSINRSPYLLFSGSMLVASNQTIRAYAETTYQESSIQSPVIEKTYIVDAAVPKRAIRISEVYPSPLKGEEEWIELENRSNQDVSLAGWQLDDVEGGGSKPYRITADVSIPPHGFLLFPKTLTALSLNNGGDDVRLLDPSGAQMNILTFPSVKTGRAFAWDEAHAMYCLTETSTPLDLNTCFIQIKKSTQKKAQNKGVKTKTIKIKKEATLDPEKDQQKEPGLYTDLKKQLLVTENAGGAAIRSSFWIQTLSEFFLCFVLVVTGWWVGRRKSL